MSLQRTAPPWHHRPAWHRHGDLPLGERDRGTAEDLGLPGVAAVAAVCDDGDRIGSEGQ